MSIRLVLSCAGICSIFMGGCTSTQPQAKSSQPRSNIAITEASRNAMSGLDGESKIKKLIDQGADVNKKDKFGRTALMEAASSNYVSVVKLLIQKGAKVDSKDNGETTALQLAVVNGNTESARILLEHGADVNMNGRGGTPLIAAVNNGIEISKGFSGAGRPYEPLDTIKILLANGANVHAKAPFGKTALIIAKEKKMKETIALLEKAGAKY